MGQIEIYPKFRFATFYQFMLFKEWLSILYQFCREFPGLSNGIDFRQKYCNLTELLQLEVWDRNNHFGKKNKYRRT